MLVVVNSENGLITLSFDNYMKSNTIIMNYYALYQAFSTYIFNNGNGTYYGQPANETFYILFDRLAESESFIATAATDSNDPDILEVTFGNICLLRTLLGQIRADACPTVGKGSMQYGIITLNSWVKGAMRRTMDNF